MADNSNINIPQPQKNILVRDGLSILLFYCVAIGLNCKLYLFNVKCMHSIAFK